MTIFQRYVLQNPTIGINIPRIISSTSKLQRITFIGERGMAQTQDETPLIPLPEIKRFISECLQTVGAPKSHADDMGELLLTADYRGHFSHGMNRLDMYLTDIRAGCCDAKAVPKMIKETVATAWVDGQNALGAVIGNFCMSIAIKKAKEVGIGLVAVKRSNHFGINSMYTMQALKEGLLGMAFTNTPAIMAPTRGKKAIFGTNPISLAAPAKDGNRFILDASTTAVSYGKIEIAKRKGISIPEGWAQDKEGRTTTDTKIAMQEGSCLMPLGGLESNSGYKGYGLGFSVEIFCGILSGASYGPNIRQWSNTKRSSDLGQSFFAINPQCFAPGFEERLGDLINLVRKIEPTVPSKSVLIPGDAEEQHMAAVNKAGGIRYLPSQMETCNKLSEQLKVKPLTGLS